MNRDLKTVLHWAREQTADGLGAPARVVEAIDRLCAKPRRPRKSLAPGKSATDRCKERRERMSMIRTVVMDREDGRCELCGGKAEHAHHVIQGGRRRARESVNTVLALCAPCHHALHGGSLPILEDALNYCVSAGMREASTALSKRIDKIYEARTARYLGDCGEPKK